MDVDQLSELVHCCMLQVHDMSSASSFVRIKVCLKLIFCLTRKHCLMYKPVLILIERYLCNLFFRNLKCRYHEIIGNREQVITNRVRLDQKAFYERLEKIKACHSPNAKLSTALLKRAPA